MLRRDVDNNALHHARLSCVRRITQTSFRPNYAALKGAILLYSIDSIDSLRRNACPLTTGLFISTMCLISIVGTYTNFKDTRLI